MNKIIQALRQGMTQKLMMGNATTAIVPAQTSLYVPVPIGTDRLLLKSVEVEASKQSEFRVEFFEELAQLNSRYNSGTVIGENYDVLDLPYIDKEETQTMHFVIHNTSEFEASYTIEVRGVAMK